MTLGEWLQSWIELYVDPSDLADNTKKCYNRAVRAVPPQLLEADLRSLSPLDLRRWLLQVAKEHPRAAQLDRVMLHRALTLAQKAGYAPAGLCDPDLLPEIKHKAARTHVLDSGQLRAYMQAASKTQHGLPLMLMCCGLRRSEALGVRWDAVDLAAATLAVVGQRLPGSDELSPLKTVSASRVIGLPALVIQTLRRMPRPIDGGWVCDISARQLYKVHAALLQQLGFPPVTLHGLRHSYAAAAVLIGVPIKVLQGSLGHARYQLTADLYADHLPSVSHVAQSLFVS